MGAGVAGTSPEPGTPELAVVVLSYRDERTLGAALESLAAQDEPLEVVVSHSGGPDPQLPPGVALVSSAERRLPGAARNAGVAATRAPYVAFLAGDCRARDGWARGRLRRHRDGAGAVASAVAPWRRSPAAVAGCLVTHGFRLPGIDAPPWLRFGLSYSRELLDRFGPFPEDVEVAEDVVVNRRLIAAGVPIASADDVVTEHSYPVTPRGLVADQLRRGRVRGHVPARARPRVVWQALMEAPRGVVRARRSSEVSEPLRRVAPLVAAGALARGLGVALGGPPRPGALAELGPDR